MTRTREGFRRSRATTWVFAAIVAAGPACSRAKPDPASQPLPTPAAFLNGRMHKLPAWGDELRARIDPARDGWPTEVVAERVEQSLRAALERGLAGPGVPAALATAVRALCSAECIGTTELRPQALAVVFDDGNFRVARASGIDPALHPPAQLLDYVARWAEGLAGLSEPRVYLHVTGVRPVEGERYETTIDFRVSGRTGAGFLQQNLRWNALWDAAPAKAADGDPRALGLLRLALERFEEVRAQRAPFAEVTEAVFGATPHWKEGILRGSGDHHLRQDRLSSQTYLGMHGLAVGDVDGDGDEDIYLPQPGGQPNLLLLHQPDGTVVEAGPECGVSYLDNSGPALLLDFDNDGDLDLAVAMGGNILVTWNDGRGRFEHGIVLVSKDNPEITSMSAADPDRDGDLDIYACRYVEGGVAGGAPAPYHDAENGASDYYWRNEGERRFQEASAEVGLDVQSSRFGLALVFEDSDEDGDDDLYVVNDFGRKSLYRNDDGRFTDIAVKAGVLDPAAGMGVTCADADRDGDVDMYVTDMYSPAGLRIAAQPQFMPAHPELRTAYLYHARGNSLFLNRSDGTYEDATERSGAAPGGWAWGSMFFDVNDDGFPEIYVPNGFASSREETDLASYFWRRVVGLSPATAPGTQEYLDAWQAIRQFSMFEGLPWNGAERNYGYLNLGGAVFADASAAFGADFLDDGRLVAPMDWDDDGRIDLLLRNRTGPRLRLLRNVAPSSNHWLALELAGTRGNRDAIGARVSVTAGGHTARQAVYAAQGFMSAPSRRLHFGLGPAARVERVDVRWPDGSRETFEGLAADARYRIVQGAGSAQRVEPRRHTALAAQPGREVQAAAGEVERIVLYDRMPIGEIEIAAYDGPPRRIGALARDGLVLSVVLASDPTSRASLEALSKARGPKAPPHAALATDEGRSAEDARRWLETLGMSAGAGPADKRFLQALEVVLVEVLGPFEKLPLPLHLLVDAQAQLCVIHCGASNPGAVLADAAAVQSLNAGRSTELLLGGHWARPPGRSLELVAQVFQKLGRVDLARAYQASAQARR